MVSGDEGDLGWGLRQDTHTDSCDGGGALCAVYRRKRDGASGDRTGGRVAIVGGGLTGIEASTEIAEAYPGLSVEIPAMALVSFSATAWRVLL